MRTFPPLLFRSICTNAVQMMLVSLVFLAGWAHADVYDDVERLIRNGQYERASELGNAHLKTHPSDPQMRLLRSRILDAQGQVDDATAQLESLTLEFPELPEPHNNLAVLYARLGRTAEAMASLNKALQVRPDYTVALENLGDLHLSLALQAYQRGAAAPGATTTLTRKASAIAPLLQR